MTNAELIKALRVEPFEVESIGLARIMNDAADALEAAEKRIAELEAQLPKEGEWVWDSDTGTYHCSECNATSPREDQDGEYIDCPNYCPSCGARCK